MLWLRRDLITIPDDALTLEKCLVSCGIARSLTEARRLIGEGAIYLNNRKVTPPGPDFTAFILGEHGIIKTACDSSPGIPSAS